MRVLFEKALHFIQVTIKPGPGQRRREMIHDDGESAPLGLGAFAGVVDDKRIKMRQRSRGRARIIVLAQGDIAPRQPFEISMLSKMHDRMGPKNLPDPKIKSQIFGRRRQSGAVINRLRLQRKPARRLDADKDIAKLDAGNGNSPENDGSSPCSFPPGASRQCFRESSKRSRSIAWPHGLP